MGNVEQVSTLLLKDYETPAGHAARCALAVKLSAQPIRVHAFGAESPLLHAAPARTTPMITPVVVGRLFTRRNGERFASWLESLSPEFLAETFTDPTGQNPRTRFESLLGVKEHEMHHRGQLMLIQRMLGITPHLTRQRIERIQQRQAAAAATAAR
jgi:hypothetical protein